SELWRGIAPYSLLHSSLRARYWPVFCVKSMSLGGRAVYAVIESGGKQYRVQAGETIEVERLEANAGDTIELDRVLLVNNDGDLVIGQPLVDGASVQATVVAQAK